MSKSGFFLSRSHVGRDSGFNQNEGNPDEIGMIGQSDNIK